MVQILKKVNSYKLKISKNVNFMDENFIVEAQATIVSCHIEDSLIKNIPYKLIFKEEDFVKVNGEQIHYSEVEVEDLLTSDELKNLLLKELVSKVFN
jgi:hypothetical protein